MIRYALFVGFALIFSTTALRADLVWDWSYSSNIYSGSGIFDTESTLTTGLSGFTGYQIISMSGTWDAGPIDQLLGPLSYQNNDNLLAVSTPQLSLVGLAFQANNGPFNISSTGTNKYEVRNAFFDDNGQGVFAAATETAEPATTVLIGSSLLALALFVRHRFSGFVHS